MKFIHEFLPKTELTDEIIDGKRYYTTPGGVFKSVTTIIGEKTDKTWLEGWRARVGEEEADRILFQAGVRGTAVHALAEKYVMNDPDWKEGAMPVNLWTFNKIKKILDERVDVVYGVEYPLWSKMLNTAGRSDLPCRFDGINTIGDFKTSRGTKDRGDIPGYFIQATAYSLMMEERTGMKFPQVAIMVAEDNGDARVHVDQSKNWYQQVRDIFVEG